MTCSQLVKAQANLLITCCVLFPTLLVKDADIERTISIALISGEDPRNSANLNTPTRLRGHHSFPVSANLVLNFRCSAEQPQNDVRATLLGTNNFPRSPQQRKETSCCAEFPLFARMTPSLGGTNKENHNLEDLALKFEG